MNPWTQLKSGQRVAVVDVEGDDAISMRIMEMGITPGAIATYLGTAPWGDPLQVEVRGYKVSLRLSEAARVKFEKQGEASME